MSLPTAGLGLAARLASPSVLLLLLLLLASLHTCLGVHGRRSQLFHLGLRCRPAGIYLLLVKAALFELLQGRAHACKGARQMQARALNPTGLSARAAAVTATAHIELTHKEENSHRNPLASKSTWQAHERHPPAPFAAAWA